MSKRRRQLAEFVKQAMAVKGLTQKEVSRRSGNKISEGYVASILTGRAENPSVNMILALAEGLGVNPGDLFHSATGLLNQESALPAAYISVLEILRRAAADPDLLEILDATTRLPAEDRIVILKHVRRLGKRRRIN